MTKTRAQPHAELMAGVGVGVADDRTVAHIDTFLRLDAVKKATGLGRSTIYDLMAQEPPGFPRPVKPGGPNAKAVAWVASEVSAWQRQKVAERDGVVA
jgi:prophage regulatory protein